MKKQPKTKQYGIYSVLEEWQPNGLWAGYRCATVVESGLKQGKLYLQKDGRDHYKAKKEDNELEI